MTRLRRLLFCALTLCLAVPAQAQVQTGSIVGAVTDSSGAVLPGVTVSLTGERLIGGAQTIITDASGAYRFDRLPPGDYTVKFELQGFKTIERTDIALNAAFTATINAKLEVGGVTENDHGDRRIADGRRQVEPAADGDEPGDSRRRADGPRSVVARRS